jgi:hypothetical protein
MIFSDSGLQDSRIERGSAQKSMQRDFLSTPTSGKGPKLFNAQNQAVNKHHDETQNLTTTMVETDDGDCERNRLAQPCPRAAG